MNHLPSWQYSGLIEATDDLGLLEANLSAGRTEAAERGYLSDPESIEAVAEVMLLDDSRALTVAQAEQARLDFPELVSSGAGHCRDGPHGRRSCRTRR